MNEFFERSFEETIGSSCVDLGGAGDAPMGGKLPAYMGACGVDVSVGGNANNAVPVPVASTNEWNSLLKSKPSTPGMGG